jgi:hypothetical protein
MDPVHASVARVLGFGVEGDALQPLAAVVAHEALRVEARTGGRDDAASNGESALCTEGASAAGGGGPVGG